MLRQLNSVPAVVIIASCSRDITKYKMYIWIHATTVLVIYKALSFYKRVWTTLVLKTGIFPYKIAVRFIVGVYVPVFSTITYVPRAVYYKVASSITSLLEVKAKSSNMKFHTVVHCMSQIKWKFWTSCKCNSAKTIIFSKSLNSQIQAHKAALMQVQDNQLQSGKLKLTYFYVFVLEELSSR